MSEATRTAAYGALVIAVVALVIAMSTALVPGDDPERLDALERRVSELEGRPGRAPSDGARSQDDGAPTKRWLDGRVARAPLLAYLFGRGGDLVPCGGSLVRGRGEADELRDVVAAVRRLASFELVIEGPVETVDGGVRLSDSGRLSSVAAGRALADRIKASTEFTVEAIVAPADTRHGGPARIVTLSRDGNVRNFTLGQEGDEWAVRLRTTKTNENGTSHDLEVRGLTPSRVHIVVTWDGTALVVYVNGEEAKRAGVPGDVSAWDSSFALGLGNEFEDRRDWSGMIRFVAFYDVALAPSDVAKAFASLPPGDEAIAPRKPPAADEDPEPGREIF